MNEFEVDKCVEGIFQSDSRRIFATLARLLGDLDLAEDATNEAFTQATIKWRQEGIPANPVAWLISAGRFRAIDMIRANSQLAKHSERIVRKLENATLTSSQPNGFEIGDDRLRLIFACCHPALDDSIQVALTLREVCGLSTEQIAKVFLVSPTTMAQRIVRGKNKIRLAGIPFEIPKTDDLDSRLRAVQTVIYLVFNEGYAATQGEHHLQSELTEEAIRLCRIVLEYVADPESMGLMALMLLHESRRDTRVDANGDIVLLEDQNRNLWDRSKILEGTFWLNKALQCKQIGPFQIQAMISACHAHAESSEATDWRRIVQLYEWLDFMQSNPIIKLNKAVAVAMVEGPEAGIQLIDALLAANELQRYHLIHAAKGDLHRRKSEWQKALDSYQTAFALVEQAVEKRFIQTRITELLQKSET